MSIRTRRVYLPPSPSDGYRVLVDRLWPRGLRKEEARIDLWLREVAPSDALRRWFGHDPQRWPEFRERYFRELSGRAELLAPLARRARRGRVTLLFGAREERRNNASALQAWLETCT